MLEKRWRLVVVLGCLLLMMAGSSLAEEETPEESTMNGMGFEEQMAAWAVVLEDVTEPLNVCLWYVTYATIPRSVEEIAALAQGAINLLDGAEGEHYDVDTPVDPRFRKGIIPALKAFEIPTDITGAANLSFVIHEYETRVELARAKLVRIAAGEAQPDERHDLLLSAQALLFYCSDFFELITEHYGLQAWVHPGESIQAAIDNAREGSTIYITTGSYRESLEITKSIRLEGWTWDSYMPFGITGENARPNIIPVGDQRGIHITADEAIEVTLHYLTIQNAWTGIVLDGAVHASITDTIVVNCDLSVEVRGTSSVFRNCYFESSRMGVEFTGFSEDTLTIRNCQFGVGGAGVKPVGNGGVGVKLVGNGTVAIGSSTFSDVSTGVLVGGMTSLELSASIFTDCFEAVSLASAASVLIHECEFQNSQATAVRVSETPDQHVNGELILNRNTFSRSGSWDLTLCGDDGTEDTSESITISGSGNVVSGRDPKLCPEAGDWSIGLFDSADN